ncbi:hypothetical protein [Leminorella grimontii]|uniref:hypothetical protein n=1 Tax=Leminorella grimontii TaxID=82981 RepID=UPI00321FB8D8
MTFRYCPLSHVFGFTLFIFVIITLLAVISTLVDIDELAKLYYILSVPTIITGICSACLSVKYANTPFRRLATTSILGGLIVFIYVLVCSTFVFTSSSYHPEECGISGYSQFIEDLTISATLGGIGMLLTLLAALIAPFFPGGKKGRLQRQT